MKVVEVELTEETYESLRKEAEEQATTVEAILRQKVEPKKPWAIRPVDMGGPFLIPPDRWREIEDEGRAA